MVSTVESTENSRHSSESKVKKHIKITEINYQRNIDSDYTEKIEQLDKNFDYRSNSDRYWSPPELSMLYGTPLYDQTTPTQKLALNHLYWATQYNQTAATEANAVLYNQVTAGVFSALKGYDTLCQELDLETAQERHHIHAFHTIGYKTKKALLGQAAFSAPLQGKLHKSNKNGLAAKQKLLSLFSFNLESSPMAAFQDSAFHLIANKVMLKNQAQYYSHYLRALEEKGEFIPAQTTGLLGQIAPKPLLKFFTLNCGSSPFLACVFYVTRFLANMLLKNYEYRYVQHYRELEKSGDVIPVPTAVSYNHLMDESFHTTTSELIAQDLYKDFTKPTAYEQAIANITIYRAQSVGLSGLSGGLVGIFRTDDSFLLSFYKLLQSPVFNMSAPDALYWIEQCFCHEHEGFYLNLKYHQRLLTDLRRFFADMDYLWPVNRNLDIMAAGGSIERAIKSNTKAFKQLSRSVA